MGGGRRTKKINARENCANKNLTLFSNFFPREKNHTRDFAKNETKLMHGKFEQKNNAA